MEHSQRLEEKEFEFSDLPERVLNIETYDYRSGGPLKVSNTDKRIQLIWFIWSTAKS